MRLGFFILIGFAAGCISERIAAHLADEFPQVTLQVTIDDEAVELIVTIPAKDAKLAVFDGLSPVAMDQMLPEDLAALVGPVFAERCPVRIDGVMVPPTILGAVVDMSNSRLPARRFPEPQVLKQGALKFLARYETKGEPRRVSIDWSIFANEYDEHDQPIHGDDGLQVVGLVNADGKEQVLLLTPQEPGYVWHAAETGMPSHVSIGTVMRREGVLIPVVPIVIVVIGGGVLLMLWKQDRRGRWPVLAATIALSVLAWRFVEVGITYEPDVDVPSDAEALSIFESLHRNIYRAFDYTDEGAVYDALAQSVDGAMLEKIYNDVYQSLIMRDQNGAVSKVVNVEMRSMALMPMPDDDAARAEHAYRVRCQWRVDGLVTHYGHSHARTNAFEAIYTLAPVNDSWRIVDAEILQQQRIDDGRQTAEDLLDAS